MTVAIGGEVFIHVAAPILWNLSRGGKHQKGPEPLPTSLVVGPDAGRPNRTLKGSWNAARSAGERKAFPLPPRCRPPAKASGPRAFRFTTCGRTCGTGTCNGVRAGCRWHQEAGCLRSGGIWCADPCSQDEQRGRTQQTAFRGRRQQSYSSEPLRPIEFGDAGPQRFRLSRRPDLVGVRVPLNSPARCTQLNVWPSCPITYPILSSFEVSTTRASTGCSVVITHGPLAVGRPPVARLHRRAPVRDQRASSPATRGRPRETERRCRPPRIAPRAGTPSPCAGRRPASCLWP